jgi:uncharacterized protein with von Willebrand factor type A (vWA) domain
VSGAGFLGGGRPSGDAGPRPTTGHPVFLDFFYKLRAKGLKVGPQEWFALLQGLERGLAGESLTGFYHLARALLVHTEASYDAYDIAFAEFFRGLKPPPEIAAAIEEWLEQGVAEKIPLEAVFSTLSPLDLEELIKRFEEKLRDQKERHDGGSQYIGTQGTSPFGRDGNNPAGVRVGGEGGNHNAVKVAEKRIFRDYRNDRTLDVRQVRVALRRLRDLVREGAEDELDLEGTIERTGKNAGDIEIEWRRPRHNKVRLLLLMDTGGSMEPYARLTERLFSAASAEKHWRGFEHFYFHNCIYTNVYKDGAFRERVPVEKLVRECDGDWKLVIVGDACMAMSELLSRNGSIDWYEDAHEPGIEWLRRLAIHFRRAVWLNPMTRAAWDHPSVRSIGVLFPMFELTVDGVDAAVKKLKATS